MWNGDKRFDYQLCVQVGEDTKEKWDKDKVVVSEDWNFHKKEFNPLETEKEIQKMFFLIEIKMFMIKKMCEDTWVYRGKDEDDHYVIED